MALSPEAHITCFKKVTYRQLIDAELVCAVLWNEKKRDVSPYKCGVCPFWHITSKYRWSISRIEFHGYRVEKLIKKGIWR